MRLIAGPRPARPTAAETSAPYEGAAHSLPARADLPSVNVANANRWGRTATLAWWSQSYPELQKQPEPEHGMAAVRSRATRWRHMLMGDKSRTEDYYRG